MIIFCKFLLIVDLVIIFESFIRVQFIYTNCILRSIKRRIYNFFDNMIMDFAFLFLSCFYSSVLSNGFRHWLNKLLIQKLWWAFDIFDFNKLVHKMLQKNMSRNIWLFKLIDCSFYTFVRFGVPNFVNVWLELF